MKIIEETKAMIHDQIFPMFLWEKASSTTVYVQNRSPHHSDEHDSRRSLDMCETEVGHL